MATSPSLRPATQSDVEVIAPAAMTNWFSPAQLIRTGVKTLLGTLFGSYLDRREVEAALLQGSLEAEQKRLDYSSRDQMWIDYVADLGDGWNSTYTIAFLLSRSRLNLGGADTLRGELFVMGGDQVYPTATVDDYQAKLKDPYRSALPWLAEEERPHLCVVPGNHDWYDGLTAFLKVFCQQRSIGAWKTRQSRSYFALKLPHRWWLWAVDIQLETDVDKPQIDYFDYFAQQLQPGDRLILCTPTSSWIDAGDDAAAARREHRSHQNLNFLEDRIRKRGANIVVNLSGDLHHYSHYVRRESDRHKFTVGGGGAYLYGTHELPEQLRLYEGRDTKEEYRRVAAYPDAPTSKRLRLGALGFFYKNLAFSAFLGAFYLFYGWLLQSASKVPNPHLGGRTLIEVLAGLPLGAGTSWCKLLSSFYAVLAHSPGSALVTLILVLSMWAFCDQQPGIRGTLKRLFFGGGHGVLHVLLALLLLWVIAHLNLGPFQRWSGLSSEVWLDHPLQACLFALEMLGAGIVLGGTLMGAYLVCANALAGLHGQFVFAAQAIPDYKNFLRMHLTREKLTVYPIGVQKVHRRWKLNPAAAPAQPPPGVSGAGWVFSIARENTQPWLGPDDGNGRPLLIEPPVEIGKQ
jgi:hypothetical protein